MKYSIFSVMLTAQSSLLQMTFNVLVTVKIGLQQLYYSVVEGQGSVEVCIAVLSGNITGSSFIFSYTTIDGLAEGT